MSLRPIVSDKVKSHEYFLKSLLLANSAKKRRVLLHNASRDEVMALAEIVANVLIGTPDITGSVNYTAFVKKKHLFRVLGFNGRIPWKNRLQAALDLGPVLSMFIGDVLPVLL